MEAANNIPQHCSAFLETFQAINPPLSPTWKGGLRRSQCSKNREIGHTPSLGVLYNGKHGLEIFRLAPSPPCGVVCTHCNLGDQIRMTDMDELL